MDYFLSFLDGIITFISPCLLPMLPIYLMYFAGDAQVGGQRTLKNALGFVIGFTLVFLALGAFAGLVGGFLTRHQTVFNVVSGGIVILFGLGFLGLFQLPALGKRGGQKPIGGFFSAALFGIIFSISWTPCLSATLGSALMLAAQSATWGKGVLMLLAYSLGLGIPFVISALLVDQLKSVLGWMKKHMNVISRISGGFLVAVGVLMATGLLGRWLALLS